MNHSQFCTMNKMYIFIILTLIVSSIAFTIARNESPTIAIITDIDHCQIRNPVDIGSIEKVVEGADENGSKALISLGDNVSHRLGDCSDTANEDLPFITSKLRAFGENVLFVLGDHDIASSQESATFWKQQTHTEKNSGKNYFSTDIDDIHVVILDTILGGDDMAESCKTDNECLALKADPQTQDAYKAYKKEVSLTRSSQKRDAGRIGITQQDWLVNDLTKTDKQKILIVSDHPLFPLTTERKSYHITGQSEVEKILQEKKISSNAQIIAISGEAHIWYHENRSDIDYYVLQEFKKGNAWALLSWGDKPLVIPVIGDKKRPPLHVEIPKY